MRELYVVKGDCIMIPLREDFFNYIRSIFAWESDRFLAFQSTMDSELNPMFIDDWSGAFWNDLYHALGIDFARHGEYIKGYDTYNLQFMVEGYNEDGSFKLSILGNKFSKRVTHYFNGYRLKPSDMPSKFFILGTSLTADSKPSKEEHNKNIKAKIKDLESRLVP
jgi:hypothetical protein